MKLRELLVNENDELVAQITDGVDRRAYIASQLKIDGLVKTSNKSKGLKKHGADEAIRVEKDKIFAILNKYHLLSD